jgi:hypothetical protein
MIQKFRGGRAGHFMILSASKTKPDKKRILASLRFTPKLETTQKKIPVAY